MVARNMLMKLNLYSKFFKFGNDWIFLMSFSTNILCKLIWNVKDIRLNRIKQYSPFFVLTAMKKSQVYKTSYLSTSRPFVHVDPRLAHYPLPFIFSFLLCLLELSCYFLASSLPTATWTFMFLLANFFHSHTIRETVKTKLEKNKQNVTRRVSTA